MDLRILFSMLSGIVHTVLAAPAGETPTTASTPASTATPGRHVRNKRCSCATFLDKECVYFCHLDIIWVNTPERVVSYGLGNAPRTRRAVTDSTETVPGPRCKCARENDKTCTNFCHVENHLRYQKRSSPDEVILPEGDERGLAANTGGIRRMENSYKKAVSPLALRAALKTRLLLEKWRVRQRHRARAWEGESTAS